MAVNLTKRAEEELRRLALSYPEACEDFPWGERVIKVRKKIFLFLSRGEAEGLSVSVKLPETGAMALMLPFAEPTSYGLGRSGWVTAHFQPRDEPPLWMLRAWVDESYRAVAPKKLVAGLPQRQPERGASGSAKAAKAKPSRCPRR